jgi:hypothetical protein
MKVGVKERREKGEGRGGGRGEGGGRGGREGGGGGGGEGTGEKTTYLLLSGSTLHEVVDSVMRRCLQNI